MSTTECSICKAEVARLKADNKELVILLRMALGAFEKNDCINWDEIARAVTKREGKS